MRLLLLFMILAGCLPKTKAQSNWNDSLELAYALLAEGKYQRTEAIARLALDSPRKAVGEANQSHASSILGQVERFRGNLGMAIHLHENALAARESLFGKNSLQAAWSCQNLGTCHAELSEQKQALLFFQRALGIRQAQNENSPDTLLFLQISIGDCLWDRPAEALQQYQKALRFAKRQNDAPTCQAKCWTAMGRAHFAWGKYRDAERFFRKALVSPDLPTKGNALFNLGKLYLATGNADAAISSFRQAAEAQVDGPDEQAVSLQSLAFAHLQSGDAAKCKEFLQDLKPRFDAQPFSLAAIRYSLTVASYCYFGGSHKKAMDICLDVQDRLGQLAIPPGLAVAVNNLMGDIYLSREKPKAAVSYFSAALVSALRANDAQAQAECLLRLANAHLENGRLDKCRDVLEQAKERIVDLPESTNLQGLEKLLASKMALEKKSFGHAVNLADEGLRSVGYSSRKPVEHFICLSLLHQKAKALRAQRAEMALPAYREAAVFLKNWMGAMQLASRSELENLFFGVYEGLLACLLETGAVEEAFRISDKSHAGILNTELGTPELDLSLLRELLRDDQAIIEYFWGEEQVFAFVVKKNSLHTFAFSATDSLERALLRFYNFQKSNKNTDSDLETFMADSRFIYQNLLDSLQPLLPEHCVIVPSGLLHFIPFETLLYDEPMDGVDLGKPPYWVQKHFISYAPSAAFWLAGKLAPDMAHHKNCYAFLLEFKDDPRGWGLLASSREEVEGVAKYCRFKVCEGAEASVDNFNELYPRAWVLHLSTHATASPYEREGSQIVFQYRGEGRSEVELDELLKLKSRAAMVVLSACKSNIGQVYRGEGVWGLARAFLQSGSRSVVTSLWEVDGKSSAELMKSFYFFLVEGKEKDEALTLAKREFFEHSPSRTGRFPHAWASFIVVGDTAALEMPAPLPVQLWQLGLLLFGLLALLFIYKTRLHSLQWYGHTNNGN